ncbi:MAG TPA: pentapeptide repeat-containing protein [Prolixibacteraceae bacterium]|nr:pentapeptide repeat-containing protein [Prolixibacteraceae bacterium]
MINTKTIGNKIAEARKKINISQAQLAERLFISSQAVGKWERGESMPDITTFNSLAEILGVDLNYFSERFPSAVTETASSEPLVGQAAEESPGKASLPANKAGKKPGWDMSSGNWEDTDFSGLKNLHEKFSSSNIQRCLFIGSDLSGLLLKGNHVVSCDFSGSDMGNSRIQGTYLVKSQLKDCLLKEAEFSGTHMEGCDFTGADFTGAVFKSSSCWKNNMSRVVLKHTSFKSTDLNELVFDSDVEDCSFEDCSFKNVTFENCTLVNTFFKNTVLKKIRFVNCKVDKLTYAFLKNGKADLTGVTMI